MWGSKEIEQGVKGKSEAFNVRNSKDEVVIYKEVETLRGDLIKYHRCHDYVAFIVAPPGTFY